MFSLWERSKSPQTGMIYTTLEKGTPGRILRVDIEPLSSTCKFSELLSLRCFFPLGFGRQMGVAVPFIHVSWGSGRKVGRKTP